MNIDPGDILICIGDETSADERGAAPMTTPIVMTSLFSFPSLESLMDGLASEHSTHVYTRGQNPTVEVVERKLAALERGEACKCFGSGMAAISAVLFGVLQAGDHVLFVNNIYGPTLQLAAQLKRFGIEHDVLLDTDTESVARAIRPDTRLIWMESPGTMMMRVLDLSAIAELARERGILTCIDNSWATPLLQKPIELGIDIVVHTASKYLNGHSDLMAGAVISTAARMRELFYRTYLLLGGILGPQEAWLLLRGMRTMPARLRQQGSDALVIARRLREHPAVRAVHHPAFDPDRDLVERQLSGYSGVFSFELADATYDVVRRFVDSLQHFRIGVSWGGVESLVISPARRGSSESLKAQRIPPALVRISVGLEGADVLLADLESALQAVA